MTSLTNGRPPIIGGPSSPYKMNGSTTSNIPLRRSLNRSVSTNSSSSSSTSSTTSSTSISNGPIYQDKWRIKYNDVEQKRKTILIDKEKLCRKYGELERRHLDLQSKHEQLETELFEKNEEYSKLSTASKNLYKEYEMLKNQYETETTAMSRALKDASQWYKQNKLLKRRSRLILSTDEKDSIDEGVDAEEASSDSDIENLNKTIKQLSLEAAELQTEVDTLKHVEFQTAEDNAKLTEELEAERNRCVALQEQYTKLQNEHEQVLRIVEIMKHEIEELKKSEENQRSNAVELRKQANDYKKERNVLAHQSALLQGIAADTGDDCVLLLSEIEELKRNLEEERNKHREEICLMQEKMDEVETSSHTEVLQERIKLVEAELSAALKRADDAENRLNTVVTEATPPPPPPPPPPPQLQPTPPPVVPLRVKRRSRVNVVELAESIGVVNASNGIADNNPANGASSSGTETNTSIEGAANKKGGVNDDIINAIKEGKFTLRKSTNHHKKERETSKTVSEILNILGNLKRAPKKRQSQATIENSN